MPRRSPRFQSALSVACFLCLITFVPAPLKGLDEHSGQVIGGIIEATQALTDMIDWSTWALQASAALRMGKPLPENPGGAGRFDDQLDRTLERVREIQALEFSAPLPTMTPAPATRDATRSAVSEWSIAIQSASMEFREKSGSLRQFDLSIKRTASAGQTLLQMEKVFARIMETVPLAPIWETAGFVIVDIEGSYLPRLGQIKQALRDKRDDYLTAIKARRAALQSACNELLTILRAEADELRADAAQLAERIRKMEARRDKLNADMTSIEQAEDQLKTLTSRIQQLENSISQARISLFNIAELARRAYAERIRLIQLRNQKYDRCPNGHSYASCTHEDLKRKWDDRQADLGASIAIQEAFLQDLSAQDSNIRRQLDDWSHELSRSAAQRDSDSSDIKRRREEYNVAYEKLGIDMRKLLEDQWRSRADIYARANSAAKQRVEAILSSLK